MKLVQVCLMVVVASASVWAEPVLYNGGFEKLDLNGIPSKFKYHANDEDSARNRDWTYTPLAGVTRFDGFPGGFAAQDGVNMGLLQQESEIAVTIEDFEPGKEYEVTWYEAGRKFNESRGGGTLAVVMADANGLENLVPLGAAHVVSNFNQWERKSGRFTATAPVHRLRFSHLVGKDGQGQPLDVTTFIDHVSIRAVSDGAPSN
ncbi:MAG: hypothetical protein K9M54_10020 [Kiritimatiellales bacterium]|nr:hypothetical protein [Kiritimatiellales bacterium]